MLRELWFLSFTLDLCRIFHFAILHLKFCFQNYRATNSPYPEIHLLLIIDPIFMELCMWSQKLRVLFEKYEATSNLSLLLMSDIPRVFFIMMKLVHFLSLDMCNTQNYDSSPMCTLYAANTFIRATLFDVNTSCCVPTHCEWYNKRSLILLIETNDGTRINYYNNKIVLPTRWKKHAPW